MSREVASLVGFEVLTADGPPVTFRKHPETISASGGLEPITTDGPLGLAVTASSDTQSLHSASLVYKGGQSGF